MLAIRAYSRAAPQQFVRHVALRIAALPSVQTCRNPLRHALHNPLHTRQAHTERAPFSGPPSYATITRRFSAQPNPVAFFNNKRKQKAVKDGEFDIHDIGGVDPRDFDILLTDLTDNTLRSEVAEIVGIPYLQRASEDEANKVIKTSQGFIYGTKKLRIIFPCVVSLEGQAHWVFFIIDSGAPLTYLSKQTAQVFGIENDPTAVTIAGYHHLVYVSPEDSHFSDINIIGTDFCTASSLNYWSNYRKRIVTFYFGNQWDVNPKL